MLLAVVDVLGVLSSGETSVEHLPTLAVMLRPSGAANPPKFVLLAAQTCSVNELCSFTLASPERTPTKWDGQSLTVYKCALLRFPTKGMTKYHLPRLYLLPYQKYALSAWLWKNISHCFPAFLEKQSAWKHLPP